MHAIQVLVALLIAVALLGLTYKLCPSVIAFLAKRLPGGSPNQSDGHGTEAEMAPLMGEFDGTESMSM